MVYVSGGRVLDSQSPWRLSIIPEMFWAVINFFVLFFHTMVNPSKSGKGETHTTDYRVGPGQGPGGGPGGRPQRRMGGVRHGGGGVSPPPMAGGG